MELFKLLGTIAVDNSEAKKTLSDTSSQASSTANAISKSNQSISSSNKSTGSSFSSLKSSVEQYKAQGMTTSQAWKKATEDMKSSTADASGSMVGSFSKIGAAVGTFLAAAALTSFGKSCLEAAADIQATESQFVQVFGNVEKSARISLTSIADNTGINENRMKASFVKIAAFAKTTGMSSADSLGLSERAMIAVADSAAFYDRSLEDTTESLQSFLKGNFENDAALGLSCTETTRNAAANKLYGKSFKDLSEEQKQLTLLQMVEDANKLSGALGQAARESDTWQNVLGNLKQGLTDFQAVIGAAVLPAAVTVIKNLAEGMNNLTEKTKAAIEWAKEHEDIMTAIGIAIGTVTAAIIAYNIAQNAAAIATAVATAATTAFGTVLAFLTSPITLVVAAIGALIAIGVLLYKNWDTVKAKCKELGTKLKETWTNIKKTVTDAISKVKDTVKSKMDSIKSIFSNVWNAVSNTVKTKINNVKSAISGGIGGAKDAVTSKLNAIRDKFQSIFDRVKTIVINAVSRIKNAFHFNWSLPKIKLPHFKVSGGKAPWGFLGQGSLPSVSVNWYKKAMDNAMLLDSPTIFGYSAASGSLLGGGEAGSEVVSGSQTLMNMIQSAVAEQNSGLASYLQKLVAILADYFPQVLDSMNQCVVLDDGTLVGRLAPRMDRELGIIRDRKDRGR